MTTCRNIKVAALDIDGVLVRDTFSPVIKLFVESKGGTYDADVETNVFSRARKDATAYLNRRLSLNMSHDAILAEYFSMRKAYIETHGGGPMPGLKDFLKLLQNCGLKLLCYGGLDFQYFAHEMGAFLGNFSFEKYVCTNDFRPGVVEIIARVGGKPHEVLFVDDVDLVAQACKASLAPFIGWPSTSFQQQAMQKTGVQHFVKSLGEIDSALIKRIDNAAPNHGGW